MVSDAPAGAFVIIDSSAVVAFISEIASPVAGVRAATDRPLLSIQLSSSLRVAPERI